LTDDGWLEVSYLGTDPPQYVVESTQAPIDFKRLDQEYYALQEKIENRQNSKQVEQEERLKISTQNMGVYPTKEYLEDKKRFF